MATVITPAMAHAQVGAGSAYAYTVHDAHGNVLDGAKTYRLHVDPDVPAKNFWAVDVYDTQTRSLIQVSSTIYPAVASNSGELQANPDGSYDLYFGPTAPEGKESNWVVTTPGKSWFQLFRLYGPLQPWFDQTGAVSLKVFPAVRLVGLSCRETIGEGDGESVECRLPPYGPPGLAGAGRVEGPGDQVEAL